MYKYRENNLAAEFMNIEKECNILGDIVRRGE